MSYYVKTVKKTHPTLSHLQLKKIKSSDDLNRTSELSTSDLKILLRCNHGNSPLEQLTHQIQKQEILERTRIFEAQRHFTGDVASSVQHSARIHSARLEQMFESSGNSRNNSGGKRRVRKETLIMGKSPQSYVKENKENYQRNGPNTLQRLRIKLKINKK